MRTHMCIYLHAHLCFIYDCLYKYLCYCSAIQVNVQLDENFLTSSASLFPHVQLTENRILVCNCLALNMYIVFTRCFRILGWCLECCLLAYSMGSHIYIYIDIMSYYIYIYIYYIMLYYIYDVIHISTRTSKIVELSSKARSMSTPSSYSMHISIM